MSKHFSSSEELTNVFMHLQTSFSRLSNLEKVFCLCMTFLRLIPVTENVQSLSEKEKQKSGEKKKKIYIYTHTMQQSESAI